MTARSLRRRTNTNTCWRRTRLVVPYRVQTTAAYKYVCVCVVFGSSLDLSLVYSLVRQCVFCFFFRFVRFVLCAVTVRAFLFLCGTNCVCSPFYRHGTALHSTDGGPAQAHAAQQTIAQISDCCWCDRSFGCPSVHLNVYISIFHFRPAVICVRLCCCCCYCCRCAVGIS